MITKRMTKVFRGAKFAHVIILIFILGFIATAPPWAHADIPRYINYQGKLTDAEDTPVTGDVSITIRIYDAESGGAALWTETQTVTVTKGVFNMLLGESEALDSLDFNDPYWYSVEVEDDGEMTPRQRLTTIAYAINADKLDGYDAADFLMTIPGGEMSITGGANEDITLDPTGLGDIVMNIDSTSGDFKITDGTTNWILVDSETGNVTIAKDLTVNGTIYGTLASAGGDNTFSSIVVTGISDLRGNIFSSTGTVTVADAFTQTGAANQVTFGGNVDANNGLDVTGALTVSGATTLSSALDINSNIDLDYSGTSAALDVNQQSTGPAAQFAGNRVVVGSTELTNTNATATGELYVQGDLEVDGMIYGNVSSIGTTSLGDTTLSSLVVSGTSDLQGNVDVGAGIDIAGTANFAGGTTYNVDSTGQATFKALNVTETDSSTSGTVTNIIVQPTFQDGGTDSTTTAVAMDIAPTINYTGSSKTGSYTALKITATETSLPTGSNYLIDAYTGDGTSQKFYVDNSGSGYFASTVTVATPVAATDAVTKAYADAINPSIAGGWTDGGTGVYLTTASDNVGIGTSVTDTYKLNVSGSTNTTLLYLGGSVVNTTAAELNKLSGTSANVTAVNLDTLTGSSNADSLHTHTATALSGVVLTAPSTAQTIQPTADVVPLTIKGLASATSNVLSIYDAAATPSEKIYVDSAGRMYMAEDTSAGAKDSAAALNFGRNSTDNWEVMGYDPALGAKGKFTFSAPLQIEASSPTGITFVEKDAQGIVSKTQDFIYDPDSDKFSFSGGTFAVQFKNLIKNSSFEAFSAFETFHGLDPNYATGTFDSTLGGMRDTTFGFEGGWQNFEPDEWEWVGGNIFQNAPLFFRPDYSQTSNTHTEDYAHGVSSVRIKDALRGTGTDNIGTGKDGEIKQTIASLESLKVYSVGIYMRVDPGSLPGTAADTTGIVDIENELDIVGLTLSGDITKSATAINITGDISGLPSNGFLWIDPDVTSTAEQISYTGKTGNKITGITRGINGTTAQNHNSGVKISVAFRPMQATINNAPSFTAFKGQFVTDNKATPVEMHLIARSTSDDGGTALFDSVQVVMGKSIPEYQPGMITDSGDQTIYGALRIGRASDEKGGILSVDKFVRTRGVEFFTDDPGFTGQKGGFGGFGGINPPTPPYNQNGTVGTLSLFTGGTYSGTTQFMNFYVQIIDAGTPNKFKWYYDDGTGTGYLPGNSDTAIDISTTEVTLGTTGVTVRFSNTTEGLVGDRWNFFATRMDPAGYDSYAATTCYIPSVTRVFKDPDPWSPTYNNLVFEDGGNRVSIAELINLVGRPSKIDSPWQEWNGATANSGSFNVSTSGNYIGATEKFYKIQIVSTGTAGSSSGTFKWSDNGGSTWNSPLTMSTIEQSIGNEGVRIKFSENPMTGDPTARLSDAYITGGVVGDTWGFSVHSTTGTSSVKTNPESTQTITPGGMGAADVTPLAIQMIEGQVADPFVIKASNGATKFKVDPSGNVTAASITGVATTDISGSTNSTITVDTDRAAVSTEPANAAGFVIEGGTGDVGILYDSTGHYLSITGQTGATNTFTGINIPSTTKYKIGAQDLSASDVGAAAMSHTHPNTDITGLGVLATANAVSGGPDASGSTILDGTITDDDIAAVAAIAQSKLNLAITNTEVAAAAAIEGTKISPDFGSQNIITTGNVGIGTDNPGSLLTVSGGDASIDAGQKLNVEGSAGDSYMKFNSMTNKIEIYVNNEVVAYIKN